MSNIISFKDKSKLQVADDVAEKLKTAWLEGIVKVFRLGEGVYSMSGVDKIITKSNAYDIFPNDYSQLSGMVDTLPRGDFLKLNSGE